MKHQYEKPNAEVVVLRSTDIFSVSESEWKTYPLVGCGEIVNA